MTKIIRPAILKKVLIGKRPIGREECEEKIIKVLKVAGESEGRIYEFITSSNSLHQWVEEYLNDKECEIIANKSQDITFFLVLINELIKEEYYKDYYSQNCIPNIIQVAIKDIKSAVDNDKILFSEQKRMFVNINVKVSPINKEKYPELYKTYSEISEAKTNSPQHE